MVFNVFPCANNWVNLKWIIYLDHIWKDFFKEWSRNLMIFISDIQWNIEFYVIIFIDQYYSIFTIPIIIQYISIIFIIHSIILVFMPWYLINYSWDWFSISFFVCEIEYVLCFYIHCWNDLQHLKEVIDGLETQHRENRLIDVALDQLKGRLRDQELKRRKPFNENVCVTQQDVPSLIRTIDRCIQELDSDVTAKTAELEEVWLAVASFEIVPQWNIKLVLLFHFNFWLITISTRFLYFIISLSWKIWSHCSLWTDQFWPKAASRTLFFYPSVVLLSLQHHLYQIMVCLLSMNHHHTN